MIESQLTNIKSRTMMFWPIAVSVCEKNVLKLPCEKNVRKGPIFLRKTLGFTFFNYGPDQLCKVQM